jgi:adenine deaminase
MTIKSGAPAATPPYPEVEGQNLWSLADFKKAMASDSILSVSETVSYLRIVHRDFSLMERLELAQSMGKLIEGHTTGASWDRLNALAYGGVLSCHESLNSKDVLSRLRLGFYVMLRHGSIRQDMENYMEALHAAESFDTSRMMLVSDGIFADHLVERGSMDWVVAEAVRCGLAPVRAIQMATLNPARYFRLDHQVGAIAPGRLAHVLVVASLENPKPRLVFGKGRLAAEEGRLVIDEFQVPPAVKGSRPFAISQIDPDLFRIAKRADLAQVPVITILNRTVTGAEKIAISARNGLYEPPEDILHAFLISRDGHKTGRGFVKGFGRGLGGIASTVAHETHGLLVLGSSPADMALAARKAIETQGGVVFVQNGEIRDRIPLPLGGICSMKPVPVLADEIRQLNCQLQPLCPDLENPLWTLVFLTFTSIIQLRLTYEGVYDVRMGKIVF